MSDPIEPADAARALDEIDRRREQVIRRKIFPRWYWWAHAGLMLGFVAALQSGNAAVTWTGVGIYTVTAVSIDWPVSRAARAAAPRRGLGGPGEARRTLIVLGCFVASLIAVMVTTALSLKAAGVHYAVIIAAGITAVLFALGGQLLVRWGTDVQVRRSGGRR
jgi:uncharacterized membrane protein YjjP (DUF1212 family)